MKDLTQEQVAAFRLRGHHLMDRLPPGRLIDVARDTGGIQAQVANAARLSFRARIRGLSPEMVDEALSRDRSLVKLWIMRHTVHVIPTEDLPMYIAALGESLQRITQSWYEQAGLTPEVRRRMMDAALGALEGGPMTRRELADAVEPEIGSHHRRWVEGSWGGAMKQGFLEGDLVFGPSRGQNETFMRRDHVLTEWDPPSKDEALARLMRRYLHAYGPARVQDFVAWTASTVRECKAPWASLAGETVEVEHGGRACSMLREDHELASSLEPEGVHIDLLGHFDTFLLGHKERTQVVDGPFLKRVSRPAGWIYPVVLANGRAVATWSVDRKASGTTLRVEPFRGLPKGTRPVIRREAKDLARFWDTRVGVVFGR
jgi:hypothetical protein